MTRSTKTLKQAARKSLQFESLEVRQTMAGDVSAYMSSGDLYVVEKTASIGMAQGVEVSQLANGLVRVKGIATWENTGTSNVDGYAYRDFNVTGNVNVILGGGNDLVKFTGNGTFNAVSINPGVTDAKTKLDDDRVFIEGITTRDGMRIDTGNGKDFIGITDALIGNAYADNLIVEMGAGQDSFDMRGVNRTAVVKGNLNVYQYSANEADIDAIYMDNVRTDSNFATGTGAGDDFVTMKNFLAGGDILISTGDNVDRVKLTNVQALDDIWILMGEGDDFLELTDVGCDRMELYGDGGIDTLTKTSPGYVASQSQSGFEQGNGALVLRTSTSPDAMKLA